MICIDHENWIKAGIEYVDGKANVSVVVTHKKSDWSVIQLEKLPAFIWIKAVRRLDAVELFYSLNYIMMQNCAPPGQSSSAGGPDGSFSGLGRVRCKV